MIRIGHGYDLHRLVEGRKLILGGVDIPYEKGLLGHSDADVLVHAVCDALLGALALGDIGVHFPDSDNAYKNADSLLLLRSVCAKVSAILAQKPKLAPFINPMRINIALACKVDVSQVSVKATTEEGLGFTGEGLGIAAHSVVLIEKNDTVV